jgi:2-polyprenyl-3-methyl-5-hydroxy-6-metoxy-1,4-benzoquinol methylase
MVHHSGCPLCDSTKIGLHIQTNDLFLSTEPFSLFKCTVCGFVFTQDHPGEDTIGSYYASGNYLSHNDLSKSFLSILYRFFRDFMLKRKRAIIESTTGLKKGNILDIGSGTGHFISEMKKSGWQVNGIEINEKARDFSVNSFGVDVISPEQISSLPSGSFDCITMWHVLEHFQDPFRLATELARLLKIGGTCFIALPNCSSFDAIHYRKFWAAYDVPRHLWHFTPKTFTLFAKKKGFEIKSVKRLPFDVFYISVLSEKYKGTRFHFTTGIIKGKWFWFCSLLKKTKSSSLIYIIKRKNI